MEHGNPGKVMHKGEQNTEVTKWVLSRCEGWTRWMPEGMAIKEGM